MVKRAKAYVTLQTIDEKTAVWLRRISRVTRSRPHLTPDPARCALLVIDMLNYFARPGDRGYLPAAEAILPRISELAAGWREAGGLVVFTRHCHEGKHDLGMLGRFWTDHIRCGFPEADIVEELAPCEQDLVVRKTTYDAFYGTRLEMELGKRKLDQVLVTGVLTQLCCETTARSAFVRGFEVYVAADGTASSREDLHTGALCSLASGVAVVMSCREVLELCCKVRTN